jgi:hypothetical protein
VELPHINCTSDHRWTYPSCGQQSRVCGSTLTTNSPLFQLLHTIYCVPLLTAPQIVFTPLRCISYTILTGYAVALLVQALRCMPEGRGCDSRWGHWDFSLNYSFRQHCGPGVDSASNSNEYQNKGGRNVGVKALSRNSGSLKLLEL